jgi:hypothetical protein
MNKQLLLILLLLIFSFESFAQSSASNLINSKAVTNSSKTKRQYGFKFGYFNANHQEQLLEGKDINGFRIEGQRYVDMDSSLKTSSIVYGEIEGGSLEQENFDGLALGVMQKIGYESNFDALPVEIFVYGAFGAGYQAFERTLNNIENKFTSLTADLQIGTEVTSVSGVGASLDYSAREYLTAGKAKSTQGTIDRAIAPSTRLTFNLFFRF